MLLNFASTQISDYYNDKIELEPMKGFKEVSKINVKSNTRLWK